jgi:hypothetical protein
LKNINPKWIRIGQDVEFEIDELMRINQERLEATLVQEPRRPLSVRLEEEMIDQFNPAHHPKARRRKPIWKERKGGDSTEGDELNSSEEMHSGDGIAPIPPAED